MDENVDFESVIASIRSNLDYDDVEYIEQVADSGAQRFIVTADDGKSIYITVSKEV